MSLKCKVFIWPPHNPRGIVCPHPPRLKIKNPPTNTPLNLTDDHVIALLAGVCAAISVSKPIQDKLATSIPKFLNEQGGRSIVGLASTGVVAAIAFYIVKDYVVKP